MQQEMDAGLSLLAATNIFLNDRLEQGVSASEIEFLCSHFRAHADSWLSRLDLCESPSSRSRLSKNWNVRLIWKKLASNQSPILPDCSNRIDQTN